MKTDSLKWGRAAFISAALIAVAGCASVSSSQAGAANSPQGRARAGISTETRTRSAKIEAIDANGRTVTLRNPDGSVTGYFCRPEVQKFDQLKIGDTVTFTVTEETATLLGKNGVLPAATESSMIRTPDESKPGGRMVDSISFTGSVVSVNGKNRELTFRTGGAGVLKTVKLSRDIDLANIRTGDDVKVQVTTISTISVDTP